MDRGRDTPKGDQYRTVKRGRREKQAEGNHRRSGRKHLKKKESVASDTIEKLRRKAKKGVP